MANTVAAIIIDWQDPEHGSFELEDVTDFGDSDGGSSEVKFALNQRPIGASRTVGETAVSLTQTATIENGEKPNWYLLRDRQLECLLTTTEVGGDGQLGLRTAYKVVVSKVDRKVEKGATTRSIELKVVGTPQNQ